MTSAVIFFFSLLTYLTLTAGSGKILFWALDELAFGICFALLTTFILKSFFPSPRLKLSLKALNPIRWLFFIAYVIGPFFFAMARANLDVAYRVVTGKIRPGIVRINPGLKTKFGITLLANSITLTPGTLFVDLDGKNNLYVHWINVKKREPSAKDVCSVFPQWARRIAE